MYRKASRQPPGEGGESGSPWCVTGCTQEAGIKGKKCNRLTEFSTIDRTDLNSFHVCRINKGNAMENSQSFEAAQDLQGCLQVAPPR